VHRVGRGEPVVVVHGGPLLDHGYLLPWLAPLQDDHELVFFDQRLSGRSAGEVEPSSVRLATFVDDIEALRSSLGLGRIHLLGHSWGGFLAMHYALRHGDRLRSLTLLDPTPPTAALWREEEQRLAQRVTDADRAEMAAIKATPEFQARQPAALARLLRASFAPQFHDRARLADLVLYVPDDYDARSKRFAAVGQDLEQFDLLEGLRSVRTPALVIYGESEPAAALAGPRLCDAIPGARLVVVPAAGHFPFLEQPEVFQRELRAFLATVGASR
jgi:proline iminopeptidase